MLHHWTLFPCYCSSLINDTVDQSKMNLEIPHWNHLSSFFQSLTLNKYLIWLDITIHFPAYVWIRTVDAYKRSRWSSTFPSQGGWAAIRPLLLHSRNLFIREIYLLLDNQRIFGIEVCLSTVSRNYGISTDPLSTVSQSPYCAMRKWIDVSHSANALDIDKIN